MKKKFLNKAICCGLTAVMLVGALTGCGNTETSSETSESEETKSSTVVESTVESSEVATEETVEVTYPIDTDVTLTIAHVTNSTVSGAWGSMEETPVWKALQEATGVKLESMELTKDAFKLMLAGGDLPDLIYTGTGNLPNGVDLAFEDKIIVPLNDYMEYAPDLAAVLEGNEQYRLASVTEKGYIIGGPQISASGSPATTGMMIRGDWLEELGMDKPETPDELYDVLVAFRDKMGAEVPLSLRSAHLSSYLLERGTLTGGFGLVSAGLYQIDGTVYFGYADAKMKDVWTYLHKLYDEGLLDPEYATIDANVAKANILSGRSGITTGTCGGNLGSWQPAGQAENPDYNLTGFASLVENSGDVPYSSVASQPVSGTFLCITSACEYPEIAAQFINYGYSEEGSMLFNYGIEGESYEMINGYPTYTDMINNNPDGMTKAQALSGYTRASTGGWAFASTPEYYEQYVDLPQQQEALAEWNNNNVFDYMLPTLTIPEEYSSEYSKIKSELQTFYWEMGAAYITGEKSLDNFETEYLATLESLNVDRYIEITQIALDNYYAK